MIRFGIVGAGRIAQKFVKDIEVLENAKVIAIASRNINRANQFKDEFNLKLAYGSYEEMAKSNEIDAVYIATPHSFHEEQTILYLKNNKHVLCEKPISVNANQLKRMIKTATENKLVLMEALWTKYLPATRRVIDIVNNGELGKIKSIDISFGFDLITNGDINGRVLNPNLAGGSLLDVGIYPVSLTHFIHNKEMKKVSTSATFTETNVDASVNVDIVFADEVTASLKCAVNKYLDNNAVIEFERGTIEMQDFWCCEKIIVNGIEELFPHKASGFEYEIDSFTKSIIENEPENSLMTHKDSLEVISFLDLIRTKIGLKYPFE